jgi:hypothetical protein
LVPLGLCPGNCSNRGICHHENQTCECFSTWGGTSCSIRKFILFILKKKLKFIIAICPSTTSACNSHGSCLTNSSNVNYCQCDSEWSGADCSIGMSLFIYLF